MCFKSTERKSLAVFSDPKLLPMQLFFIFIFWKAPIPFHSRCSRLVSCYRIDSSEYISQIHVPTYLQDGIRVGNEEGGQRSGFSHHCPCPVVLGITILIQEVLHHDKEPSPEPLTTACPLCDSGKPSKLFSLSLSFFPYVQNRGIVLIFDPFRF